MGMVRMAHKGNRYGERNPVRGIWSIFCAFVGHVAPCNLPLMGSRRFQHRFKCIHCFFSHYIKYTRIHFALIQRSISIQRFDLVLFSFSRMQIKQERRKRRVLAYSERYLRVRTTFPSLEISTVTEPFCKLDAPALTASEIETTW